MKKNNKKVYVLHLEWDVDCTGRECEVQKVSDNFETIKMCFQKEKNNIINNYTKNGDDFEVDTDTETLFEYQRNYWEEWYILKIVEKDLI